MLFREFVGALRSEDQLTALASWSDKEIAQVSPALSTRYSIPIACII